MTRNRTNVAVVFSVLALGACGSEPWSGPVTVTGTVREALRDGHTATGPIPLEERLRRRGLGSGLGAALRLSDRLVQEPLPKGKRIVATRFLVRPR